MSKLQRQDTSITDTSSMTDSMHSLSSVESSNDTSDAPKRSVTFADVSVREFNRVVGDHPDCKFGPPLSIGWEFNQKESLNVDEYEETRSKKGLYRMSALERKNILNKEFGISEKEIAASLKEVQKILKQREQTKSQSKQSEKVESFMQSAKRKMKRSFSRERIFESMSKGLMFPMVVQ